jgi:predicted ATPase/DNA-binding XRE family transcriptional regulator
MDQPASPFAALLRQHRLAADLSQEALAERAGLSVQAIGALERGDRRAPYRDTVDRLAGALALAPAERDRFHAAIERGRRPADRPAAPSPSTGSGHLPAPATSFVGRDDERATVRRLLDSTRLLTLTGAGGVGKTRLALHVAAAVEGDYADGARLVELAPLADPALAPQAVAVALAVREESGRALIESVGAALAGRRLLLVLDNCEHLREAVGTLAQTLLRAAPGLRILATSRAALGVIGETVWRVPPLALPEADSPPGLPPVYTAAGVGGAESAQLFGARAAAAYPAFALTDENAAAVAAICRRLDGIPLALELAAARTRVLAPEQIAARLDDRLGLLAGGSPDVPVRQQTLRAALDWSYDLLAPPERALFERLAVFEGGCDIEAAEYLSLRPPVACAPSLAWEGGRGERSDVLDLLTSLVDKSLITIEYRGETARYRLLDVVRAYAFERLAESGELEAARARHRAWFRALAEASDERLVGPEQPAALARLSRDIDNLRAALTDTGRRGDAEEVAVLVARLWRFWFISGRLAEGRARLDAALAAGAALSPLMRARLLDAAGTLAQAQGAYIEAQRAHEESLAIWRELGERNGIAGAAGSLGLALKARGALDAAIPHLEEALALWREAGQEARAAMLLNNLAAVAMDRGDFDGAEGYLVESLALKRRSGDRAGVAISLHNLADTARARGQYERAAVLIEESLALSRALDLKPAIAQSLHTAGLVALRRGELGRVAAYLDESLRLCTATEGRAVVPLCLEALAETLTASGDARGGARLLGAAEAVREDIGAPLALADRTALDATLAAIRDRLSDESFEAAWDAGRALTIEQASAAGLDAAARLTQDEAARRQDRESGYPAA